MTVMWWEWVKCNTLQWVPPVYPFSLEHGRWRVSVGQLPAVRAHMLNWGALGPHWEECWTPPVQVNPTPLGLPGLAALQNSVKCFPHHGHLDFKGTRQTAWGERSNCRWGVPSPSISPQTKNTCLWLSRKIRSLKCLWFWPSPFIPQMGK